MSSDNDFKLRFKQQSIIHKSHNIQPISSSLLNKNNTFCEIFELITKLLLLKISKNKIKWFVSFLSDDKVKSQFVKMPLIEILFIRLDKQKLIL